MMERQTFVLCLCSVLTGTLAGVTPNVSNSLQSLQNHVVQLEQTISNLETQYQTQEQKYAAVLQSVLSRLASTTDEMTALKADHNSSVSSLTSELASLKSDLHVCMTSVHVDVQSLNTTVTSLKEDLGSEVKASDKKLESLKSQIMTLKNDVNVTLKVQPTSLVKENTRDTVNALKQNLTYLHRVLKESHVAFDAKLTHTIESGKAEILKFDDVSQNIGSGYHNDTGIFVAPVSGTYFFWCHVTSNDVNNRLRIVIKKNGQRADSALTPPDIPFGLASVTTLIQLDQHDHVTFIKSASQSISGDEASSYGGFLLYPEIK